MRGFERLASGIDVKAIVERIESMPELWSEITARQDATGSPHKNTECIFVRGPYAFTLYYYMFDCGSYDYPVMDKLQDVLVPVMYPLLKYAIKTTELGRVLIVNLKSGATIAPHIDQGKYADHFARFHLALTGNEHCALRVEDEEVNMQPGELWWFNHKLQHSGHNRGETDRWHIIIDAVSPIFPMAKVPVSIDKATNLPSSGVMP